MAPAGHLELDHRLEPQQAARSVADELDFEAPARRFRRDRVRRCIGAHGAGGRIAGHVDLERAHRASGPQRLHQLIETLGRNPALQLLVDHQRGSQGAIAETIDRLERDRPVRTRSVKIDPEAPLGMSLERRGADRLAGLGAAQVHHVPAAALGAEIVIESDHAVDFGPRQIELLGDQTAPHPGARIRWRPERRAESGAGPLACSFPSAQARRTAACSSSLSEEGRSTLMGITRRESLAMHYPVASRAIIA